MRLMPCFCAVVVHLVSAAGLRRSRAHPLRGRVVCTESAGQSRPMQLVLRSLQFLALDAVRSTHVRRPPDTGLTPPTHTHHTHTPTHTHIFFL